MEDLLKVLDLGVQEVVALHFPQQGLELETQVVPDLGGFLVLPRFELAGDRTKVKTDSVHGGHLRLERSVALVINQRPEEDLRGGEYVLKDRCGLWLEGELPLEPAPALHEHSLQLFRADENRINRVVEPVAILKDLRDVLPKILGCIDLLRLQLVVDGREVHGLGDNLLVFPPQGGVSERVGGDGIHERFRYFVLLEHENQLEAFLELRGGEPRIPLSGQLCFLLHDVHLRRSGVVTLALDLQGNLLGGQRLQPYFGKAVRVVWSGGLVNLHALSTAPDPLRGLMPPSPDVVDFHLHWWGDPMQRLLLRQHLGMMLRSVLALARVVRQQSGLGHECASFAQCRRERIFPRHTSALCHQGFDLRIAPELTKDLVQLLAPGREWIALLVVLPAIGEQKVHVLLHLHGTGVLFVVNLGLDGSKIDWCLDHIVVVRHAYLVDRSPE
mmetsp:Transcript_4219/g.12301  ORF Transcript_4219/g.12301 Transcript_4219/m.12301 type:complete len:443 (-) Transcript_4219:3163-4491(-)